MKKKAPPKQQLVLGLLGGGLIFASIFLAAYGVDVMADYLAQTQASPFITSVLKWAAYLIYFVDYSYLVLLIVGLIVGLRKTPESKRGR